MKSASIFGSSRLLTFIFKLLISAGLIAYFVWQIDLARVLQALRHTRMLYLAIGFILYPLGQVICVVKWQYLAKALGIQRDLRPMIRLYFIGMFFNMFLPTSIGGDITRGLYLSPGSSSKRVAFLSVIAERGTGVLAMMILASVVMLSSVGAPLPNWLRFGFPVVSIVIILGLWFLPLLLKGTRARLRSLIYDDLIVLWEKPRVGLVALIYSVIFHCILVVIHICIARALSLNIPAAYHFITETLASLASLLPSFSGIGVRDGAYLYLLGRAGIEREYALLFSFLWFLIMAISSCIGCIMYLIRGLSPAEKSGIADQANGGAYAERLG
jgi:glycosyltransferase 2 family protein